MSRKLFTKIESTYDELDALESIIMLTQHSCRNQECNSVYYDLIEDKKFALSEERNHYINMLALALDKISILKKTNLQLEEGLVNLEQYANNSCR